MTHLDRHAQSTSYCAACPKLCAFACPVSGATRRETTTPWAKMSLGEQIRQKRLPYSQETLDPLTYCLSCRLCTTYCKHEIDVGEALAAARADAFEAGVKQPKLAELAETFVRHGAPSAADLGALLREQLDPDLFAPEAQVVLFPGCRAISEGPHELRATFDLLRALRIDFVAAYSGPDFCCGAPLYYAGYRAHFKRPRRKARASPARLQAGDRPLRRVRLLPQGALRRGRHQPDQPHQDAGRILGALSGRVTPTRPLATRAALHLAPHDARYLSQGPRLTRLAQAALSAPLTPLVWQEQSSYACGSTGVLRFVQPQVATTIAAEVLRQAREVGAETLLTSSPGSGALLREAQKAQPAESAPALLSVIELLARAYGSEV